MHVAGVGEEFLPLSTFKVEKSAILAKKKKPSENFIFALFLSLFFKL